MVPSNNASFNSKLFKLEKIYRRNHSIHYYLKRKDVVTALAEVRKGSSAFVRDKCNRTALDMAIVLFMKKFHESIFTSLITDYLYIDDNIEKKNEEKKKKKNFPYNTRDTVKYDDKCRFYPYEPILKECTKVNKQQGIKDLIYAKDSPSLLLLQRKIKYVPLLIKHGSNYEKKNSLFLLEKAFIMPMSKNVQAQLNEELRNMRALLFFIKMISTNVSLKKYSEDVIKDEISKLSFPYLYNITIHTLFKIFYSDYGQVKKWDLKNPANSRKLVSKILSNNLMGNEIIKFIGKSLFYFSNLVHIFGQKVFKQNSVISQYLLHMSFTLDNEYLFNVIINKNNLFQQVDIFHWDKLIESMSSQKHKLSSYYKPLLYARLNKLFLDKLEEVLCTNEKKTKKDNDHLEKRKNKCRSTSKMFSKYKEILDAPNCNALESAIKHTLMQFTKEGLTGHLLVSSSSGLSSIAA
ncbi:conserved Plasmodium protein, unknown function [Plasmodium malariae]|uniref:Uncharacterized protein n=1 Tax=Plasmodium malariae TaxID=5858 RepID=A0A1D3JIR3_PLAMA|nr:conserved Plasmodium protein, unknown function [Plasmodium malariae]SBT86339.1 conserved Plasmodium protein, unknown function [Plasmodium malariae]